MFKMSSLPFGTFGRELDTLLTAVTNKLQLEWPTQWVGVEGANFILRGATAVSHTTYRTIIDICSDTPPNPQREPLALSATPLARTILDALFLIVFLLDDLPTRTEWYYKAGWREIHEELDRLKAAYGTDPAWSAYNTEFEDFVQKGAVTYGMTVTEQANPRTIDYWPIPGKMKRYAALAADRKAFLEYTYDWFYKEFSADSHLSLPGLARRAFPVLEGNASTIAKQRSDAVFASATLVTTLASELQLEIRWPSITPRLEYVWAILNSAYDSAKDIYDRRYAGKLL